MEDICNENNERIEEVINEGILSIRKSCSRRSYISLLSYVNNSDEFN